MTRDEAKTWIEFDSKSLLKQFKQYLKDNAKYQHNGYAANYGIVQNAGKSFYSDLEPFNVLQKLCKDFDQVAHDSVQWGDLGLVNAKTGKCNNDTSTASALTHSDSRCWYNIKVSTRVSAFSQGA